VNRTARRSRGFAGRGQHGIGDAGYRPDRLGMADMQAARADRRR